MISRNELLQKLKSENFDILVIGGGATGSGIALDAVSRGLKVALVERDDFASGTSSRSTKLVHGGVRYLEQAVKKLDRGQYLLVREALHERATLLRLAPHLAKPLPLITPIYSWLKVPYLRLGLKMYDWVAGKQKLKPSRFLSAKKALKNFPMLKSFGLKGGVLYYDGQFNDARMNVAIARTAIEQGAVVLNHISVETYLKEDERIHGAVVRSEEGNIFPVRARVVINATGPFVDILRQLDEPDCQPMLRVSSGIHIVLDKRFSPPDTGLLIPQTDDGRVLFLLPWLGHTLVGTTDNPAELQTHPKASEEDIQYILHHLERYFDIPVKRQDVLSCWSGLRPLVSNPNRDNTAALTRDHVIEISKTGLLTVTGGKWTTYRSMAKDAVDRAVAQAALQPKTKSRTDKILLWGAYGYSTRLANHIIEEFKLEADIAAHLTRSYGGQALRVAEIASQGYGRRLAQGHPFIEAEILFGVQEELAQNALDLLARRMRLTFLDERATLEALPRTLELLAEIFSWNTEKKRQEEKRVLDYLDSCFLKK